MPYEPPEEEIDEVPISDKGKSAVVDGSNSQSQVCNQCLFSLSICCNII